jgi:heme-degrading monooxygenase HmoA
LVDLDSLNWRSWVCIFGNVFGKRKMIYRSILRFHVRAGMADEFQAAYDAGEFLTGAADVPGFIRAILLRQESDDHEYVALAEGKNKEA